MSSGVKQLKRVQFPELSKSLLFLECRHCRNSLCGDGTEISRLLEVHASWFDDFIEVKAQFLSNCTCSLIIYFNILHHVGCFQTFSDIHLLCFQFAGIDEDLRQNGKDTITQILSQNKRF